MIRTISASLVVCALATPLAAQTRRVAASDEGISVRAVGFAANQQFAAKTTFDAAFDDSSGRFFGGGVLLGEAGVFMEVTFSRFKQTGQRAYLFNGQAYRLNIPLTATITPFEVSAGYRFRRQTSIVPYVGGGVGSYGYKETASFGDPADDVDARHAGFLMVGGAEFRVHRLIGVAADVQYTRVPGILGNDGLSKDAGESNLGGIALRAKIIVGVGR